jgi:hypothetical protein
MIEVVIFIAALVIFVIAVLAALYLIARDGTAAATAAAILSSASPVELQIKKAGQLVHQRRGAADCGEHRESYRSICDEAHRVALLPYQADKMARIKN